MSSATAVPLHSSIIPSVPRQLNRLWASCRPSREMGTAVRTVALLCGAPSNHRQVALTLLYISPSPATEREPHLLVISGGASACFYTKALKSVPFPCTREKDMLSSLKVELGLGLDYSVSHVPLLQPAYYYYGCSSCESLHLTQEATTVCMYGVILVFSSAKIIRTGVGNVQLEI